MSNATNTGTTIGVPKEIKTDEARVGLTPAAARELVHHGHRVLVETQAGHAIGLDDEHYRAAGAAIAADAAEVFARADMIVKVLLSDRYSCA